MTRVAAAASAPGPVPADDLRISFAPGTDREAAVARACATVLREGVVVLDDLVDPALVERCRRELAAAHPEYEQVDVARNFGPYPLRHTTPVVVAGALAERALLLPPPVAAIANHVLDPEFEVDSVGVLVSLVGAPEQKPHPDATLFGGVQVDRLLPTFGLALAIPLVPMDEVSGTTAFWRGSHRRPDASAPYDLAPILQPGSALLWDFRTIHCGLANRGARSRPVIFTVLGRPWWSDIVPPEAKLYEKLLVHRTAYDGYGAGLRRRLRRARIVE